MSEHNFTLVLDGDVDTHIDDLYEAGCDDASFGEVDGVPYAEFDRDAPSLGHALISAIAAVESVDGIRVIRVEPDNLVTAAEIAERLGRTRESVRLLIAGRRGPGNFPAPATHLRARTRLWRWSDVAAWAGDGDAAAAAELVVAMNAALELRDTWPRLGESFRAEISRVAQLA